ncbi:hypothetical protein N0B44_15560 [Roseibacterium beibuensis]|uniref:DUF6950 domain-containing protein n=1 Tax=[Roseibacterium] beibuensis TaxID=1193142 RepID=A0ABP9L936_9RHOB|nr:hypothetical protein [Roseibacterium beibuensis]MCS6624336.1 hypothetical protein [Roseibacterium beibuensis]
MAELLTADEYLRATASQPFAWGRTDCVMWATGLIVTLTGRDPFADLRGAYHGPRLAYQLMEAEGGMVTMFERRLGAAGDAGAGAAVCLARLSGRLTAGICNRGRGVFKTACGIAPGPAPFLAWPVEGRR